VIKNADMHSPEKSITFYTSERSVWGHDIPTSIRAGFIYWERQKERSFRSESHIFEELEEYVEF